MRIRAIPARYPRSIHADVSDCRSNIRLATRRTVAERGDAAAYASDTLSAAASELDARIAVACFAASNPISRGDADARARTPAEPTGCGDAGVGKPTVIGSRTRYDVSSVGMP